MKTLMIDCAICGHREWQLLGVSTLLVGDNQHIPTNMYECKNCGVLFRDADEESWWRHFQCVRYTLLENESEYKRMREGYFEYISRILERYVPSKPKMKILDIGCSYGHFLDIMKRKGYETSGVEINETLYERLKRQGIHEVFRSLEEVQGKFQVITLIDSLYCVADPSKVLEISRACLTEDGIILCRVSNRVWLIKLSALLQKGRVIPKSITGDARWSFSTKSLKTLFTRAGFSVLNLIYVDKGKKGLPPWKTMFYFLTQTVSSLTPLKVSPGIILVARKKLDFSV